MFYNLIEPLGLTTLILMLLTAFFGSRLLKIKAKIRLRIHKILAISTVILALCHGSIVFYYHFLT